ncbi:Putative ubiquinone biosynthesis monooxygenase [Umbelopsis nana]
MDVWRHLHQDRIKPYHDMQVWDAVSGARVQFNTSMLDQGSKDMPIAWMIENVHLQNGILQSVADHNSNGANMEIIEKTKVANILYVENEDDRKDGFDLSDWPTVELSNGRKLKTRLLVDAFDISWYQNRAKNANSLSLQIGADGANSPVRNFAKINSLGWDYDTHAVVATLEMDNSRSNETAWQRFLPTGPIAILPLKDGISSMVWSTKPHMAAAIKALPEDAFCHLVNAALRLSVPDLKYLYKELVDDGESFGKIIKEELTWRESVGQLSKTDPEIRDTEMTLPPEVLGVQKNSRAGFPLRLRNAERYIADRIALVGDAAHTIHPLAGQGLNQGLLDVQKLSEVLEAGVKNGEDIGHIHLLSHYASNRYGRNVAMLSACDKIHRLFGTEFEPIVWARSFGFHAVNAFDSVKPTREWTHEQLESDSVSKKDIVSFLQENASAQFLLDNKLNGKLALVAKNSKRDKLVTAYEQLFETKNFRGDEAVDAATLTKVVKTDDNEKEQAKTEEPAEAEVVRYKKLEIMKKGNKTSFPRKGDMVAVWYTGTLEDGKVFDTNVGKKKAQPLKFKVGTNRVIRGWDEALLTMSKGEKCKIFVEAPWAYGKKGVDGVIPPNANLNFEIELVSID